jgi:hypothetical protein
MPSGSRAKAAMPGEPLPVPAIADLDEHKAVLRHMGPGLHMKLRCTAPFSLDHGQLPTQTLPIIYDSAECACDIPGSCPSAIPQHFDYGAMAVVDQRGFCGQRRGDVPESRRAMDAPLAILGRHFCESWIPFSIHFSW